MKGRILVIDDEPGMCRLLDAVLTEAGYGVDTREKPAEALRALESESYDLVVTDVRMPKIDGLEVLDAVRARSAELPVIVITAHGTLDSAVGAMKRGASDYLAKPFKNDEIKLAVEGVLEKRRLRDENRRLKAELADRYQLGEMAGKSPAMLRAFELLAQLARSEASVLLQGESGTGKELAARAVHFQGPRASGPFIPIHCGALPETLMESELFGHVKGAFTDALKDRVGLLEAGADGTVFLDEVGEMPPSLQVKLLRFLQDHEVRRLGSTQSKRVNVRVVAASNKDLKKAVAEGKFREDLYYRLAVVTVQLPPLRERREDVPLLAARFLEAACRKARKPAMRFTEAALQALCSRPWPGNVRELQNAVEHVVALHNGPELGPETLPFGEPSAAAAELELLPHREAKQRVLEAFERSYLVGLLERAGGNMTRAAELADMDRKNLYDLLKKHGLGPVASTPQP